MKRGKRWAAALSAVILLLTGSNGSPADSSLHDSLPSDFSLHDSRPADSSLYDSLPPDSSSPSGTTADRTPRKAAPYAELLSLPKEESRAGSGKENSAVPPEIGTAPGAEAVPTETVPAETVPAETVPTETVPAETVLTETVPIEEVQTGTVPTEDGTGNVPSADSPPMDSLSADSPLKELGDNPEKRLLLFGDENWGRYQVYASEEEAEAHMTTVQVPVWLLWGGAKSRGTMYLTVHQALAEDVAEIFSEIFHDPEQFPMESVGGFRYRAGTTGEHNNGTAIDINADQNYQVRDGAALTGSCWEPGVNPFSIPADGSVVRIFAAHGWSWGGDAWADSVDDAEGYHDYMHFSYRGR